MGKINLAQSYNTVNENNNISKQTTFSNISKNNGGLWGGLGYLGEKLAVGFTSSLEGIWDYSAGGLAKLFGADDWAEEQFENDWFGDWYSHPEEWYNPSDGWKVAGDVAGGIGTSLPAIGGVVAGAAIATASGGSLSPVAAGLISASVAGLGAAGNATKQAYRETGELTGKEFGYGALVGITEGSIEGISGAIGAGTGQVVKGISKAFAKETTKTVAKQSVLKTLGKGFIGEAFEEGVAEIVDPYWQRLTYNPDAQNATMQEVAYAAFVGGMSGMLMSGGQVAVDSANSFVKGNNLVNKGLDVEVLGLSEQLAAFEKANNTGDETFQALADTYTKLTESIAQTGGKVQTVTQKKLLGDLQGANTVAVFKPMILRSAANIVNNAEVIAQKLNEYGYKGADGKPVTFTAEQIRQGVDVNDPSSFAKALKENNVLRTLAVSDTTGHLTMDTARFKQSTLAGQRLASQVDLNRFMETATPEEINAVSEALGIEDWSTLNVDTFNQKVVEFVESGRSAEYAKSREGVQDIHSIPESAARPMPKLINLRQDGTVRYSDGDTKIAITKNGDAYTIYDYSSGKRTKSLTRAEVNKILRDYNVRKTDILAGAKLQVEQESNLKKQAAEIDAYARGNIPDYAKLSDANKSMIRKIIREGRALGLAEADILAYAAVSAHSGLDIVYDKRACYKGKNEAGEDVYYNGFFDPHGNRIVVNPESKNTQERILIHELDHAIRAYRGKDGKMHYKSFAKALKNVPEDLKKRLENAYKGEKTNSSKKELYEDEANAYFSEDVLSNKNILKQLVKEEPKLADRILSFFKKASSDYESFPRLSKAARSYYKTYKKLFDQFSERNFQNNAYAESAIANKQKDATRTNNKNVQITDKEKKRAFEKAAVNSDIVDFVESIEKGSFKDNDKVELKKLPEAVTTQIKKITGIDVSDFKVAVEARQIAHILKDHGKNGITDHSMENVNDIAKMEYVMQKPDSISPSGKTQAYSYMRSGKNRTADTVIYEREIGDKSYYIVQAVADTKKKTLFVVSAFIGEKGYKKGTSQLIDAINSPNVTPEDGSVVVPKDRISQTEGKVNTNSENSSDNRGSLTIVEEKDAEYMAAVATNDVKTLQKMIDDAAKEAGYIKLFYHGAKNGGGFTIFRDWSYFTENKQYAERYAKRDTPGALYKTFVKLEKAFDTRKAADRRLFNEIRNEYGLSEIQASGLPDWTDGYDISDYIDENDLDYDGILLDEGGDMVNGKPVKRGISYIVRKSAQIKSSDPITYDDNGEVIPLSKRFDSSNNDIRYSMSLESDISNRTFSYEELVSKGELSGVVIGKDQHVKIIVDKEGHKRIDSDDIVSKVQGKCKKITTKSANPTYYVEVADIGKNVEISNKGIRHGYIKGLRIDQLSIPENVLITARASLELPNILANSIEVNISGRSDNNDIPYSHIMMGTVGIVNDNGNTEYYAVRSVIDERINQNPILSEAKIVAKLHAMNAKKIGSPTNWAIETINDSRKSGETYAYRISQFLEDVKGVFDDTFSLDVYNKLGVTRATNSFSADLRYSLDIDSAIESTKSSVMLNVDQEYKPNFKDKVFSGWTATKIAFVNEQAGIEAIAKRYGIKNIESFIQAARSSGNQAEEMIAGNQYRIGADSKTYQGEGLEKIFRPIYDKGDEVRNDFYSYLFHYHNISRMTLNKRSIEWNEQTKTELKGEVYKLNGLNKQIEKLNEEIKSLGRKKADLEQKKKLREEVKKLKEQAKSVKKKATQLNAQVKAFVPLEDKPIFGLTDEKGIETVITAEQSEAIIRKYEEQHPDFKEIAEKVWEFQRNLNQYRVDTGLISQETFDYLNKLYPHYVPTFRTGATKGIGAISGKYNLEVKSTVKMAKGSTLDLLPPDVMMARQVMETVRAGRINQLASEIYYASLAGGDKTYIEVVSKKKPSSEELAELDPTELRPKDNEITFFKDGEKFTVRVSKEIFAGFDAFNPKVEINNPLVNGARAINNGFKRIVTSLNPAFLARNSIRDIQDAGINTRYGKTFLKNYARAQYEIRTDGKLWQLYKAMGGFNSSVFDFEKGFAGSQNKWGLTKAEGNVLKKTLTTVENANAFVEQLPRLAEFISSLEVGNTAEQAILDSADVTTNFGRSGKITKVLNRTLIPFLNPSVQGFSKIIRNITSIRTARELGALLAKVAIVGIIPMALNMALYGDDEDYEDLRDTDKENNYLFKIGDTFIKVPKGRVASVLAGLVNRTSTQISGEDADWEGYVDNVLQQITPVDSFSRTIFSPFADVQNNITWYGSAIEGRQFENTAPKDRYDENTSSIAIAIGQLINYSPKKIHYLLDQYSGVIGDFILPATTAKAEKDFLSGNFTLDPATSNRLSTDFYEMYDQAQYAKTAGDDTAAYQVRYLNKVKSAISDMYKQKSEIQNNPDLSNAEKLQQTRVVQLLINEAYKTALQDFELYTKAIEATAGMEDENLRFTEATRLMYGAERALSEYNDDVYAKCQMLNKAGVDYEVLYSYYFTVRGITSDKDYEGNTISGSKRKKVVASIKGMNISVDQKLLLICASGYALQDNDLPRMTAVNAKKRLLRYILNLKGATQTEKTELAEMCGFELKNGRVVTKSVFSLG